MTLKLATTRQNLHAAASLYAQPRAESQIRLVANFSRWLAKRQIILQEITTEHCQHYLRFRARHRSPGRSDLAALKRLLNLLLRQGVIPEPPLPAATPADQLRDEFGLYLRQERALATTTVRSYLSFVGEFLAERFGSGPIDLSTLCAADVTGFVRRRAASIKSKRVQLVTTALRSFLRFGLSRGSPHGSCRLCARRRELVAIDRAQGSSAGADRTRVSLLQPEDGCGPTRLRDPVAPGAARFVDQ
jgi:site-specific recombinase XerD